MVYKPENVKLVVTHDGVEQEIQGFDESTFVENPQPKKTIVEVMLNNECLVMAEEQLHGLLCETQKLKIRLRNQKLNHHVVRTL